MEKLQELKRLIETAESEKELEEIENYLVEEAGKEAMEIMRSYKSNIEVE